MINESLNIQIKDRIDYISKNYNLHGFWKYDARQPDKNENPYIYFPSEEVARQYLTESFNNLTDEDYKPLVTTFSVYFKDGDEVDLSKIAGEKIIIHTEIEYDSDGPYAIVYMDYKDYETESMIFSRLISKIFKEAKKKYIKDNFE